MTTPPGGRSPRVATTGIEIADPEAPPTESFTVDSLATAEHGQHASTPTEVWRVTSTSADFGQSTPIDDCLQITPSEQRTAHYWVRDFTGGAGARPHDGRASRCRSAAPPRRPTRRTKPP